MRGFHWVGCFVVLSLIHGHSHLILVTIAQSSILLSYSLIVRNISPCRWTGGPASVNWGGGGGIE